MSELERIDLTDSGYAVRIASAIKYASILAAVSSYTAAPGEYTRSSIGAIDPEDVASRHWNAERHQRHGEICCSLPRLANSKESM